MKRKLLALTLATIFSGAAWSQTASIKAPGLLAPGFISYDAEGVPTVSAQNDRDAAFLLGYAHARDRFFQMDFSRRGASGTVSELVGSAGLPNDIQIRTLGLRRAAFESWVAAPAQLRESLKGYAEGVNFWLSSNPLPPEYGALELTQAEPWTPVDTLVIGKALAFQLSFGLDIDFTLRLGAYQAAGVAGGFNGSALLLEDTHRAQGADGRVSIPGFLSSIGGRGGVADAKSSIEVDQVSPETLALAEAYRAQIANHPLIGKTLNFRDDRGASNWWMVAGRFTESGRAMMANDPHLGLDTPAVWMESHITSTDSRFPQALDTHGVSVPGTPLNILGCTNSFCWGLTTNPMDVTDVFQETIRTNTYGIPAATVHGTTIEPVLYLFQSYFVNNPRDGIANNLSRDNSIGYANGALTIIVPRRNNGPIVQSDTVNNIAFSVAYTGWGPTQELEAFRRVNRANSLQEFRDALSFFDVGSQNFAYTGQNGDIAYFVTAEAPIRTDLQRLGAPDGGVPPYFIRTGNGSRQHDWLPIANRQVNQATPFEVLPLNEMPFAINPSSGYLANCNNDPIGVTNDNNPLNQLRPGGGIYYLDIGYSDFRQGRIDRLLNERIASNQKVDTKFLEAAQANTQALDAELLRPFLEAAALRIGPDLCAALGPPGSTCTQAAPTLPAELARFRSDAQLLQAARRLRSFEWDLSSPTGIREGFDAGDDPSNLAEPSAAEIRNATATTIYSLWRARLIANTVDATLARVGLGTQLPGSEETLRAVIKLLRDFPTAQGRGASGLDFFQVSNAPGLTTANDRRDFIVLQSLREALDRLASADFAPAFNRSTNIDDYRWGRLHRIVFDHPLGGPFNIPGANPYPFRDLASNLPGLARQGTTNALDVAAFNVRAQTLNGFMFGSGPARRFIGDMTTPIKAQQIIPGGQSGVLRSPLYVSQLGRWLTNRYKNFPIGAPANLALEATRVNFTP